MRVTLAIGTDPRSGWTWTENRYRSLVTERSPLVTRAANHRTAWSRVSSSVCVGAPVTGTGLDHGSHLPESYTFWRSYATFFASISDMGEPSGFDGQGLDQRGFGAPSRSVVIRICRIL